MLTIRRAQERDIPRILELLVQVNMVHHTGRPDLFRGPTTKYSGEQLREVLKDDGAPVFVCTGEADRVLGHAFCQLKTVPPEFLHLFTDVRTLYVDDICVDAACRGQGVGRALYEHVCAFAREQGCYNVQLTVWACNPGARAFYERLGMTEQKAGMEVIL